MFESIDSIFIGGPLIAMTTPLRTQLQSYKESAGPEGFTASTT
jgi:hypothetical protein